MDPINEKYGKQKDGCSCIYSEKACLLEIFESRMVTFHTFDSTVDVFNRNMQYLMGNKSVHTNVTPPIVLTFYAQFLCILLSCPSLCLLHNFYTISFIKSLF